MTISNAEAAARAIKAVRLVLGGTALSLAINAIGAEFRTPKRLARMRVLPADWFPPESIPRDRAVLVLTVTGIECLARVQTGARIYTRPHAALPSISCRGKRGDLSAIGWKHA